MIKDGWPVTRVPSHVLGNVRKTENMGKPVARMRLASK